MKIQDGKVVQIAWSYRRQSCATPAFFVSSNWRAVVVFGPWSCTTGLAYVTSAGTRHRNTPGPAVPYRYRSRPVSRFLLRSPAFFVRELSAVFELLSSSVNFLVYCVVLRRFRRRFLAAVATSCTARRTDLAPGRPVHSVT